MLAGPSGADEERVENIRVARGRMAGDDVNYRDLRPILDQLMVGTPGRLRNGIVRDDVKGHKRADTRKNWNW